MSTTTQAPRYSEPVYAKSPAGTNLPWWVENIDKYLTPEVTKLLEEYSKISRADQSKHVHTIRDKTYRIRSYPNLGTGCFLTPYIARSPAHDEVIEILKAGGSFFDIGTLLGSDMRQLVFDGAPSDNMIGVDIVPDIWDIGFEMYNDRTTFKGQSLLGDLLSLSKNEAFEAFKGNCDVISLSAVLHQWDWDTQATALKQVIPFSKVGTIFVGYQIGNPNGHVQTLEATKTTVYKQSPTSFAELWKQVSDESQTEWNVQANLRSWEYMEWDANDMTWMGKGDQVFDFVVRRTA